ncbi:MAG TPA: sorbosone dehydrogenase family protein [Candidatus Obscuribacterales bacterium]
MAVPRFVLPTPARWLSLALLFTTAMGCSQVGTTLPARSRPNSPSAVQTPTAPSSASTKQLTAQAQSPNNLVSTETLTPTPIRLTVADLSQPYATNSASKSPDVIPAPNNPVLRVPAGFTVNVFAEELDRPRWLALTPNGEVLVTETRQNRIRLLRDSNGDGVADVKKTFAGPSNGLFLPLGMAFTQDAFFLGNTNAVLRFPYQPGQDQLVGQGQQVAQLPGEGYNQHWTRNVVVSPDQQKLYVSVGSESNADTEPLPRASVQVMNLDGSNQQTFAYGLRNPVGLDFHPLTGALHATVNERDGLGDDLVPDYLTQVQAGEFYGWPYTYLAPNLLDPRHAKNGESDRPELAAQTRTPDVLFQAHSAALGLQFYDGNTFPQKYRNGAFVAFRGSWNRNQGTGYKVVFVPFNAEGRAEGYYEDFLTGFLLDPNGPTTWGRPVGLLVLPDGSLLVSEEANGRIYRIQYQGS